MAKINDIKNLIQAAAKNNMPTYAENGNTALQTQINEPVIPLPNNPTSQQPSTPSIPSTSVQPTQQKALIQFLRTLKPGRDYGNYPGIPHPILLREGALRIMKFLNLRPHVTLLNNVVNTDGNNVSYTITVKLTLIDPDGSPVAESIGSASTLESRFSKAGGINTVNTVAQQAQKRALVSVIKMLIV